MRGFGLDRGQAGEFLSAVDEAFRLSLPTAEAALARFVSREDIHRADPFFEADPWEAFALRSPATLTFEEWVQ